MAAIQTFDVVADLSEVARQPTIDRTLAAVRELLDMELAYFTTFRDGVQVFEQTSGDAASFGVKTGGEMPLDETYCQRILTGRLPNVVPDVRADDRAATLPITSAANVGAFASVPLVLSDGSVYGTLCAGSHQAKRSLGYRELQFLHVFARLVADQVEREQLEASVRDVALQAASASALVAAVDARDSYTADHSREVVDCAIAVARELGLDESTVRDIEHVALLHDIGKIAVPDSILHKPGPLSSAEWEIMRRHPLTSESVVSAVPALRHLAPAVRAEHERWDGGGYPDGLAGEQIPLASRITFACDAYNAMTSDRPYRRAMSAAAACAEIRAGIGSQFCPRSATALLAVVEGQRANAAEN